MSAPVAKKDTFPLLRDLAVFAATLGFFAYSLRALPPPPASSAAPAPSAAASRLLASRQPASVASASHATATTAGPNVAQYDLSCPGAVAAPNEKIITGARLVRLRTGACTSGAATARNETTGEQAIVFTIRGSWVTSYFPLAEGPNELVIEWREKGKARAQKLRVTRSSGST